MSSYYEKMLATGEVKCIDEEVPFEIPKGWEWCKIKHICSMQAGKNISASKIFSDCSDSHPYRCVGGNGLRGYTEDFNTEGHYSIVGRQGALCGCVNIEQGKFYATEHAVVVDTYEILSPLFMYYFLTALNLNKYATATAQPGLAVSNVLEVMCPLPPLNEGERIIEKLSLLIPLIENYNVIQEKQDILNDSIKEQLKKSVLQEAIQGKLVPQLTEEGTAQDLLEQIRIEKRNLVNGGKLKKSALATSVIFRGDDNKYWEKKGTTCECIDEDIPFDIPKSWAWVRLETILNTGSAHRVHAKDWRQAGIPFYRAREIGKLADDGFVDNELYIDLSLYEDFSSSGVPLPNDLMITAVGTLGKVYIVKENDKFYYKDGSVLCLANKYGLCAEYLKMVIESPSFKGQYRQESQGTTVATLTMVRLQKYFIPLPPLQEQYRIVETYRNIASIMSR